MPAGAMADQPYDVTAWTLPLQMGVEAKEIKKALEAELTRLDSIPPAKGELVTAARGGARAWGVAPGPNSSAILANRLLKEGAEVSLLTEKRKVGSRGWDYPAGSLYVRNVAADKMRALVTGLGLGGEEATRSDESALRGKTTRLRAPRVGLYQPWTASMDEGWTRWLLEQFEFSYATLHNPHLNPP